ncbi:hypothetical protein ACP70R_040661 [Stipagrostis hirtigluma subsp. patula]
MPIDLNAVAAEDDEAPAVLQDPQQASGHEDGGVPNLQRLRVQLQDPIDLNMQPQDAGEDDQVPFPFDLNNDPQDDEAPAPYDLNAEGLQYYGYAGQ